MNSIAVMLSCCHLNNFKIIIDNTSNIVYIDIMTKETRLTILIDEKLRSQFKSLCASEGTNMTTRILQYIEDSLRAKKK